MQAQDQREKHNTGGRAAVMYIVTAILILLAVGYYIYSRTYMKAARIGVPMTPEAFSSIMSRSLPALVGMFACGVAIAVVSLCFQTAVNSRILTPSMIGFDSIFVGTQTLLVFTFGSVSALFSNPYKNFLVTAGAMVVISVFMYRLILRNNKNNVIFLLMFGIVFSGIVRSATNYLQIIMDTNSYNRVKAATSVTVNNMNTNIILLVLPILALTIAVIVARHRKYDVMALGRDNAKSLGLDYDREININLVLIAVVMSVVTALIGSLTFLGLLAVNITRELLKTHRHRYLFIGSALAAALVLILGQAAVEALEGAVPLTAVIDLAGCSYMFALILKENHL